MDLPIDARRAPFRPKYIDSETSMFNSWIIFGRNPADGTYTVSDGTDDIVIGLTSNQAISLVRARLAFVQSVLEILNDTERQT